MTTKLAAPLLIAVALLVSAPACVLGPLDQSEVESRTDPIRFEGYTRAANARVRIQAWNHDFGRWDTRADFLSTDVRRGRDIPIYEWDRTLTLPSVYWIGTGGSCWSGGMARIRIQELVSGSWSTLSTFNQAGWECLNDKLADGLDAVPAGYQCRTGSQIVLFAPPTC